MPTLAILICTCDRPDLLRRCLAAIAAGTVPPTEVLVSDDSPDGGATAAVCADFPGVRYMRGPRRGLCANRNALIRAARGDFVSLLDDDGILSPSFVAQALTLIADLPAKTLVTGSVIERQGLVEVPGSPYFLGFMGKSPNGRIANMQMNCNLFPRRAFQEALFDEAIFYGYDEVDICAALLSRGYSIRHDPALVNTHLPPLRTATVDKRRFVMAERARFYTSVKRYMLWERDLPKLLAYIVAAPAHRALHAARTGKWYDLPHAVGDMVFAIRAALRERARIQQAGPALV